MERDPNEKLIVGDVDAKESVKAKEFVAKLTTEVETIQTKLKEDGQADLEGYVSQKKIADFRTASNLLDELLDDSSAAGVQRLQRLMINELYVMNEDMPFPVSRKGKQQPRGPIKKGRVIVATENFLKYSKQYFEFFA